MGLAALSQVRHFKAMTGLANNALAINAQKQQAGTSAARNGFRPGPDPKSAEQSFRFPADGMTGLIHPSACHQSELK